MKVIVPIAIRRVAFHTTTSATAATVTVMIRPRRCETLMVSPTLRSGLLVRNPSTENQSRSASVVPLPLARGGRSPEPAPLVTGRSQTPAPMHRIPRARSVGIIQSFSTIKGCSGKAWDRTWNNVRKNEAKKNCIPSTIKVSA